MASKLKGSKKAAVKKKTAEPRAGAGRTANERRRKSIKSNSVSDAPTNVKN